MRRIRAFWNLEHLSSVCSHYLALRVAFFALSTFLLSACDLNLGYFGNLELVPQDSERGFASVLAPNVFSISPTVGLETGQTTVTILGENFTHGASASIGGAKCVVIAEVTSNTIICITSENTVGSADVVVTNTDGRASTLQSAFTYEVNWTKQPGVFSLSSISPPYGLWSGGTQVTLTGNKIDPNAQVNIGGVKCTSVTVNAERSSLSCTTSAYSSSNGGTVDVVVTNPGNQTAILTQQFTYLPSLNIKSVYPNLGPLGGGTTITLTGSAFIEGISITLDGLPCTSVNVSSFTDLTCVTPAHGEGTVTIAATFGEMSAELSQSFTYTDEPIPEVSFPLGSLAIFENRTTPAGITVNLSSAFSMDVTIPFTVSGTASYPNDHDLVGGQITIPAGQTEGVISFDTVDDAIDENNESVVITMGDPINAIKGSYTSFTVNIMDDDDPPLANLPPSEMGPQNEIPENSDTFSIPIRINQISSLDITIPYTISGTATYPDDHNVTTGNVVIPAGSTEGLIPVTFNDDLIDEDLESIVITMGEPINAIKGAFVEFTINIKDNDDPPVVNLDAMVPSPLIENGNFVRVIADIAPFTSSQDITISYELTGSATPNVDYSVGSSLVIRAGDTQGTMDITMVDDLIDENETESVTLTMLNAINGTVGTNNSISFNITDNDDPPAVNFSTAIPDPAIEGGSVSVIATTGSALSIHDITVPFSLSGSATNGDDYTFTPVNFTIPAGFNSGSVTFNITADLLDEIDTETVMLTMGTPANGTKGTTDTISFSINDIDSPPLLEFGSPTSTFEENSVNVMVNLSLSSKSKLPVTVPYSVTGSATNPEDHNLALTGNITIPAGQPSHDLMFDIQSDNLDEDDETVIITMGTPTNATPGTTLIHTVTITDNDPLPVVQWGLMVTDVTEGGQAAIAVSLTSVSGRDVTVPFSVSGTASNPEDHDLSSGSIVIPAGGTSQSINYGAIQDEIYEGNETIIVTLEEPTNATLGAAPLTINILDDENEPEANFISDRISIIEDVGSVTVTASISRESSSETTIPFTVSGTATYPADHDLQDGNITISAGETSGSVTIHINNDNDDENPDTVILTMGDPSGASKGTNDIFTLTINDDDDPPEANFLWAQFNSGEIRVSWPVTVFLDARSDFIITVPFTVTGGTATNPADHNLSDGNITINPGDTEGTLNFNVVDDNIVEGLENITIVMGNPTNATKGTFITNLEYTINDNDEAVVDFLVANQNVGEGDASATITAAIAPPVTSTFEITVPFTVGGTATEGTDFNTIFPKTITIPPGSASGSLVLSLNDDEEDEPDETVIFTMGNPSNATKGDSIVEHTVTLIDDDFPAPDITNVTPNGGPPEGGTNITITGTGFLFGASVLTSDLACASINVVSDTEITCTTQNWGQEEAVDVTVVNIDQQADTLAGGFTYRNPPTVTGVSPASVPATGADTVTIIGTGFIPEATVTLGGIPCDNPNVTSPIELSCVTRQYNGTATVSVVVTNPDEQFSPPYVGLRIMKAPAIQNISISEGPSSVQSELMIAGTEFFSGLTVSIGSVPCGNVVIGPQHDLITCDTGINGSGTGTYDVIVEDSIGQLSNTVPYKYWDPPDSLSLDPAGGPPGGGYQIEVMGRNLTKTASIMLDGDSLCESLNIDNDTKATCSPPAHVAGAVDFTVTDIWGQEGTLVQGYLYAEAPEIVSIDPAFGPLAGLNSINLTGNYFQNGAEIKVDNVDCTSVSFTSSNLISCDSMPSLGEGAYDITVINPDYQSHTLSGAYTYQQGPEITSVDPTIGPSAGNITVDIWGSYFRAGPPLPTVSFGGAPCVDINIISAGHIQCTLPSRFDGNVNVTVTNYDNQTDTLTGGFTYYSAPNLGNITPNISSIEGGETIELSVFPNDHLDNIDIGGKTCEDLAIINIFTVSCTCPVGSAAQSVDVVATDIWGQTDTVINGFTYTNNGKWTEMSTTDAPVGRNGHTGIWTGSHYIVWGGWTEADSWSATGGIYDPITDTWTATPAVSDPTNYGRADHEAVWTGKYMIVWGGSNGRANPTDYTINTGLRFDPIDGTWSELPTLNAPSDRTVFTLVWTGTHMIVWGGRHPWNGDYLNDGGAYELATDSWDTTKTNLINAVGAPSERKEHLAVWTGRDMIIWGGFKYDGSYDCPKPGGMYHLDTDTWATAATHPNLVNGTTSPMGRVDAKAVWTGREMIMFGGANNIDQPAHGIFNTGGVYYPYDTNDPSRPMDTWVETPETVYRRTDHLMVWTGRSAIVWGGTGGTSFNTRNNLSSGDIYDPLTNTWTRMDNSLANRPTARQFFTNAAVWTGSEMIVWGGYDSSVTNTGARYKPPRSDSSDTWTATSTVDAPDGRFYHSTVWTGSEMIVWGGSLNGPIVNTGGRYNPLTNSWTATSTVDAPVERCWHSGVWTGSEMIVWGGSSGSSQNTGGKYDPVNDSWQPTSALNAPDARCDHSATWTGSEMIVWGGRPSGFVYYNTGGRYDPVNDLWTPMAASGLTERYKPSSLWTGSKLIIWGGCGGQYHNTGGIYDPADNSWLPISTIGVPSGRCNHTAVWTGSKMIVWGGTTGGYTQTGGIYNPVANSWNATSINGAPSARTLQAGVWTGTHLIIWGGGSPRVNTGGKYNPSDNTWTLTSTLNAPDARWFHHAVWTGSQMIVWGGDGIINGTPQQTGGIYTP